MPVAVIAVTFALVAPILPTLASPVAFSVPVMLAPVPVTTNMFALPTALILTLPFAAGILTFELPFATGPIKLPTLTLPVAVIAVILALVAPILPTLALPVALRVPATLTPVEVAIILAVAFPAT